MGCSILSLVMIVSLVLNLISLARLRSLRKQGNLGDSMNTGASQGHTKRSLREVLKAAISFGRTKRKVGAGWVGEYPATSWVRFKSYSLTDEERKRILDILGEGRTKAK